MPATKLSRTFEPCLKDYFIFQYIGALLLFFLLQFLLLLPFLFQSLLHNTYKTLDRLQQAMHITFLPSAVTVMMVLKLILSQPSKEQQIAHLREQLFMLLLERI